MWLHVPFASFRSAPEPAGSISASDWRFPLLARSAGLNGKPTPPQSWYRAWRTKDWIKLLCGAICEPSTAQHGVERWIASWRAIPASRSLPPESAEAPKIHGISGPTLGESLPRQLALGCSSKTSVAICDSEHVKSSESFTGWATALRRACLQRRKWARRTNGSGCSSWPTPMAGAETRTAQGGIALFQLAAQWPTPCANDDNKSPQAHMAMKARMKGGARHTITSLQVLAQTWATPPTRDHKDGSCDLTRNPTNGLLGRQVLEMTWAGPDTSQSTRVLNPRFVEALMGWPIGHSVCVSLETAWSRLKPPTPSASSEVSLASEEAA